MKTILLLQIVFLASCSSYKMDRLEKWNNDQDLTKTGEASFDGSYRNAPDIEASSGADLKLWDVFTGEKSTETDHVNFCDFAGNVLQLSLIRDSRVVKSIEVKYEAFPTFRKLDTIITSEGLNVPGVWAKRYNDISIGIAPSGNLRLNYVQSGLLMIGILPTIGGGGGNGLTMEYSKAIDEEPNDTDNPVNAPENPKNQPND